MSPPVWPAKNHEKPTQDCQCLDQDLNQASPKYKSEALPLQPVCLCNAAPVCN
jgi:hypothetical protein